MKIMRSTSYLLLLLLLTSCAQGGEDSCEDLGLSSLKIMSGTRCGDEERSPVVLIELRKSGDRQGYCSGAIIGRRSVLSAAHCVEDVDEVKVRIGGRWQTSKTFIQHPAAQIDDGSIEDSTNDLSIISIPEDTNIQPLKLARRHLLEKGDEFSIYGFGQSEEVFNRKNELRSGKMEVEKITNGYFESSYENESSICFGDSGGPALLLPSGGKVEELAIVGVASALSLGISLPLPIHDTKAVFSPFPLPFPIFGSSCPKSSKTFHAAVYNQSALDFITNYASDVGFVE